MFIYIGIWEAILVLIVVILLTMLTVWWYWRRRLRELEELHERHLAEEISDLIKGFEHQAVNCLRPIKDNLHLIKGRMKRLSVAEGEEWHHALGNSLGVIEYYEWRLTRLIENMAILSQLEAPGHVLGFSKVKLDAIVDDVVRDVYDIAEAKGTELTWRANPEDFPRITANQDGLRQVFINLIDNAIKYCEEGDRIDVVLEAEASKDVVRAHVSDTGQGIPEEDWERIFDKGYTVEGPRGRRPREGGRGLGLYIVKLVAEKHKGRIAVQSQLGEGTTFTLTLPIQRI
jgi:signal transduction histidine kinase